MTMLKLHIFPVKTPNTNMINLPYKTQDLVHLSFSEGDLIVPTVALIKQWEDMQIKNN